MINHKEIMNAIRCNRRFPYIFLVDRKLKIISQEVFPQNLDFEISDMMKKVK